MTGYERPLDELRTLSNVIAEIERIQAAASELPDHLQDMHGLALACVDAENMVNSIKAWDAITQARLWRLRPILAAAERAAGGEDVDEYLKTILAKEYLDKLSDDGLHIEIPEAPCENWSAERNHIPHTFPASGGDGTRVLRNCPGFTMSMADRHRRAECAEISLHDVDDAPACEVCGCPHTQWQMFGGGKEYYCPNCDSVHGVSE